MVKAVQDTLIGRDVELGHFDELRRQLERGGAGYLWISGEADCGKSRFLRACADRAEWAGWEVLRAKCTEETSTDPYGPFLAMLGLCFDKGGRLINDRSVYSIVDQISLNDVFDAVADIPGMSVVTLGIKVGMTIFEARRRPQSGSDLLNRNFEFILQLFKQIEQKRQKPVLLALDDLHLASATTYALIEYILTRIEDARLLIVATWRADSVEASRLRVRGVLSKLAQIDRVVHLSSLSEGTMRGLLRRFASRPLAPAISEALIDSSRGLPGVLEDGVRLAELGGEPTIGEKEDTKSASLLLEMLLSRQLSQFNPAERDLLQCASLIGQRVPLDLMVAPELCAYLGIGVRGALAMLVDLADHGSVLAWDGQDAVRFTSEMMRTFLRDQVKAQVARRDHLHIAEAWRSVGGGAHPGQLALHYLAGGDFSDALAFALQSAEELSRSAAYPEAMQSYRLALTALDRSPDRDDQREMRYDILYALGLAAEQIGEWDDALAWLQDALAVAREDLAREAEILGGLGWLHLQRGEMQVALSHLSRSAELYEQLHDVQGQAQVEYYMGVLYGTQKEWNRAIACFERYLEVSREAGFQEGCASAYIELGDLYRSQRDWQRAERFLQQGIALAEQESDYVVLAQGYHYLGNCYARQGKVEAIGMLQRALDIVHVRTKQPAQEARIQNTLAETLVRVNRWGEAEAAFQASAAIKERLGDRAGLAMTFGGLGRLYLRQWRFDAAVAYLERDIALLAEEFDANVAWIQQQTNLVGEARRLQGCLEEAEQRSSEALALADRIPDQDVQRQSRGYTQMLLARVLLDRHCLEMAEEACATAMDLLAGTWAEGEVLRTAARLARVQGRIELARERIDRALALSEQGEAIDRAQNYLEQACLYREIGDVPKMREAAERVIALARQLCNVELEQRAMQLTVSQDDCQI